MAAKKSPWKATTPRGGTKTFSTRARLRDYVRSTPGARPKQTDYKRRILKSGARTPEEKSKAAGHPRLEIKPATPKQGGKAGRPRQVVAEPGKRGKITAATLRRSKAALGRTKNGRVVIVYHYIVAGVPGAPADATYNLMGVYSLPVGTEGYKSITMSETELQDYLDHGLNAEEIAEAESGEPLEGITIEDVTIGPAVAK
jgi:hypothetical protein